MSEVHQFEVSNRMVDTIIRSQNGSLSVAMLELISNSYDAKANRIDVTLSTNGFTIKDDGVGFESKQDIINKFKTLGDGSDVTGEASKSNVGRFHVGRSQSFVHGITTWSSKSFKIEVDYTKSASFVLTDDNAIVQGCIVKSAFYEELNQYHFSRIVSELKKYVRFMTCDVFINGVLANDRELEWNYSDEVMDVALDAGQGIEIYSTGVFIKSLSSYDYGFTGVISCKQRLELNLARNATSDNDEVWKHVITYLRKEALRRKKAKRSSPTETRRFTISQIKAMEADESCVQEKLFIDINGKQLSLRQLTASAPLCGSINTERSHAMIAETATTTKVATFLSAKTFEEWDVGTANELIKLLKDLASTAKRGGPDLQMMAAVEKLHNVDFKTISDQIDTSAKVYKSKELKPKETIMLGLLQSVTMAIRDSIARFQQERLPHRELKLGVKDGAEAFTDGSSYIVLDRGIANRSLSSRATFYNVVLIIAHEFTHDDSNIDTNKHNKSFYQSFHDSVIESNLLDNAHQAAFNYARKNFGKFKVSKPKWLNIKEDKFDIWLSSSRSLNKTEVKLLELMNINVLKNGKTAHILVPLKSLKVPSATALNDLAGEKIVRSEGQIKRELEEQGITKSESLFYSELSQQKKNDQLTFIGMMKLGYPIDEFEFCSIGKQGLASTQKMAGLNVAQNLVALLPSVHSFAARCQTKVTAYGNHTSMVNGSKLTDAYNSEGDAITGSLYKAELLSKDQAGLSESFRSELLKLLGNYASATSRKTVLELLSNQSFIESLK